MSIAFSTVSASEFPSSAGISVANHSLLAYLVIEPQNGSVYVSTEVIAIVISAAGVVVTLGASMFAGFAWILRRIDDRGDAVEDKLSARIDALDMRLSARIDGVEEKLGARIDALAGEVTGVKIAVARLEGPPRHLVTASH